MQDQKTALPKIEVTDYKGVKLNVPTPMVQDSDVESGLENLRQEHAQYSPVENGEVRDGSARQ